MESKEEGRRKLEEGRNKKEEIQPPSSFPLPTNSGFTIDDSHLTGNIFSGILDENDRKVENLPGNSPGYQQSKAQVQRQVKAVRKRLHPEKI